MNATSIWLQISNKKNVYILLRISPRKIHDKMIKFFFMDFSPPILQIFLIHTIYKLLHSLSHAIVCRRICNLIYVQCVMGELQPPWGRCGDAAQLAKSLFPSLQTWTYQQCQLTALGSLKTNMKLGYYFISNIIRNVFSVYFCLHKRTRRLADWVTWSGRTISIKTIKWIP